MTRDDLKDGGQKSKKNSTDTKGRLESRHDIAFEGDQEDSYRRQERQLMTQQEEGLRDKRLSRDASSSVSQASVTREQRQNKIQGEMV